MTSGSARRGGLKPARVLIGAYACGDLEEPEAAAGWHFAVAASLEHEVHVITRERFREQVERSLQDDPALRERLSVEFLELPAGVRRLKRRPRDVYWYYVLWQRSLGRRARELHRENPFDVLHHVTFANDWLPCGLLRVKAVPLVWGPVGGASRVPFFKLRRWLGARGLVTELVRSMSTGLLRRVWGDPAARRAAIVVAQNPDVARRFRAARRVVVEPNASLQPTSGRPARRGVAQSATKSALFVGRLVGWKGARLAIHTIAHPLASDWTLTIYGDGFERTALERLAHDLGVGARVVFEGHRPRVDVIAAYEVADAFLFPSMHDQAGWVVAEASSLGCPVVCLPLGGPPTLAVDNAFVAALDGDLVRNLAAQLELAGRSRGLRHDRWSRERLPALVADWYSEAISARL